LAPGLLFGSTNEQLAAAAGHNPNAFPTRECSERAFARAQAAGQAAAAAVMSAAGNPAPDGPYWQTFQRAKMEAAQASMSAARAAWTAEGGHDYTIFPAAGFAAQLPAPPPPPANAEIPSSSNLPLFPNGNPNLQETQIMPPTWPSATPQAPKPSENVPQGQTRNRSRERSRDRSRSPRTTAEIAAAAAATAEAAAHDAEIAETLRPRDTQVADAQAGAQAEPPAQPPAEAADPPSQEVPSTLE
jgi:hypothetical protein